MPKIKGSFSLSLPSGAWGLVDEPKGVVRGLAGGGAAGVEKSVKGLAKGLGKAGAAVGTAYAGYKIGQAIGEKIVEGQEKKFEEEFGEAGREAAELRAKAAAVKTLPSGKHPLHKRDIEAVRKEAEKQGITEEQWYLAHGYTPEDVEVILSGQNPSNLREFERLVKHGLYKAAVYGAFRKGLIG